MDYRPEKLYVYGPPKSLRARLANRVRRLFGREERWIVYYALDVDYADNADSTRTMQLTWNTSGEFLITDVTGDKESPGSTPTVQG